jgi:hypothetical protein
MNQWPNDLWSFLARLKKHILLNEGYETIKLRFWLIKWKNVCPKIVLKQHANKECGRIQNGIKIWSHLNLR